MCTRLWTIYESGIKKNNQYSTDIKIFMLSYNQGMWNVTLN